MSSGPPDNNGGAYLPGGAHMGVHPATYRQRVQAAAALHKRATDRDDLTELAAMLGLTDALTDDAAVAAMDTEP